ncbi:MAG: helix-turn-helix domain-containing protein [bacterium]
MKLRSKISSDVMTVEQVADYLQLNKLTVYKYIRDGRLPASKLGKSYRVRMSDVDAFLETAKQVKARRIPPRQARGSRIAAARKSAEEVYVGPQRREEADAPHTPSVNPMDWVIRGLH